jgi:hypothetical protein
VHYNALASYGALSMSDEATIPPRQEGHEWIRWIQAQYGGPAFIRRGKRLLDALHELEQSLARLRQPGHDEDWLAMVRVRLGQLYALAGGWKNLEPLLDSANLHIIQQLYGDLQPQLRLPPSPDPRPAVLRSALRELQEAITYFNRRWLRHLQNLDLSPYQRLIADYNRYYVLEKECFLQSPRLARLGFKPLPPLSWQSLLERFPLLPVPQLREQKPHH